MGDGTACSFAAAFADYADLPALKDGDRTLTYEQLLALGRAQLAGLPRPRSLVVLRCALTAESVAAHVALMVDGHVPLLIEDSLAAPLADAIIARYRPDAVVGPAGLAVADPAQNPVPLHPALGLLLTTSGSTGSPKLVRLSSAGVHANAASIAQYLALTPAERPLLHLPMSYSYGLSVLHSHLLAGACTILTRSSVMEPGYWADLEQGAATSIAGVPFHYAALRRFGKARLAIPTLTTLTQAGGRLDPKLGGWFAEWAARTGRRFVIMYGQTEAGPRIAWLPPEQAERAPEAIGVPIPGATITLVDADGHPVADGQPGDLQVQSSGVMMGYAHSAEDLTLGDTMGGLLRTGDLAVRGPDGLLRIVGRQSRLLKVFGLRVNLDEIESRLQSDGASLVCFGEDDRLCVLSEGSADPAELRAAIVTLFSLPPRGIEVRRAAAPIPRLPSGKLSADARTQAWEAAR